jgi:exosortase/archaeosortase family protein
VKTWLPIAVFAILWLDLIRLLSTQWETREQYAYGWFVPIFAAALLWRRWLDRPAPSAICHLPSPQVPLDHRPLTTDHSAGSHFSFQLSALCFLLCLLLLPLRVIYEINTDWPLISWVYTLIVVALTLYAFHLADPSFPLRTPPSALRTPWVRHFAFPVCFILVAVVWPYRIEKGLTQDLMQVVASLTVELLGWLDIPALQRGNLIELGTGTVGIDEACSGIRSFQSSLMAALLMGELYRLRLLPRAALVVSGITLGFCFNVMRTLLLSYQANQQGLSAIEKWHDPAGLTITVACFFCLWALAVLITKWTRQHGTRTTGPQDHRTTGLLDHGTSLSAGGEGRGEVVPSPISHLPSAQVPVDLRPLTSGSSDSQPSTLNHQPPQVSSPVVPSSIFHLPSSPAMRFALAVGLWSILCIGATEAWYRSHTPKDSGVFHWSVALPEGKAGFEKVELAPRTIKLLKYDLATTGKWRVEDGSEWSVDFFRWQPRSIESVINSRVHRPEVCLPAAGFRQLSSSKLIQIEAGGLKLPFRKYTYEMDGRKLYVFFCQWEDGAENQAGMQSSGQADRLQSVLKGRRLVGQQTLEIIVTDCNSLEQAEQQLRKHLPELIRLEPAHPLIADAGLRDH